MASLTEFSTAGASCYTKRMTDIGLPHGATARSCSVCHRPLSASGTRHRTCLPPHPSAPMHFTDFDTRLAAYALLVDHRGHVLLAANTNRGPNVQWALPGGGVDFDETPVEALIREAAEETGREVAVGALLGAHTDRIDPARRRGSRGRPMKTVQLIYAAEIQGAIHDPEPGAVSQWFGVAEVAQLRRRASVDVALSLASSTAAAWCGESPARLAAA